MFNGVVYLSIYYQNFGINIFSYLEFTEVITAFVDSLKNILLFFSIYLLHVAATYLLAFTQFLKQRKPKQLKPGDVYIKPARPNFSFLDKVFKIVLIIQIAIAITILLLLAYEVITINKTLIYLICFILINVIHWFVDSQEKILQFTFGKIYYEVFDAFLIFVLPFFVYTIACAEYASVTKEDNAQTIELFANNKHVNIHKNYKLIGKTSKYIFLYDFKTKKCLSVSLENVTAISYTNHP